MYSCTHTTRQTAPHCSTCSSGTASQQLRPMQCLRVAFAHALAGQGQGSAQRTGGQAARLASHAAAPGRAGRRQGTRLPLLAHVNLLARAGRAPPAGRSTAQQPAGWWFREAAAAPLSQPLPLSIPSQGGNASNFPWCDSYFVLSFATPFASPGGGRGITPACPSSRATVSDGCAPTDSQYLRGGGEGVGGRVGQNRVGWEAGAEGIGRALGVAGGCWQAAVLLLLLRSPSIQQITLAYLIRSTFSPRCLLPSLPAVCGGGFVWQQPKEATTGACRSRCCEPRSLPGCPAGAAACKLQAAAPPAGPALWTPTQPHLHAHPATPVPPEHPPGMGS